MPILTFKEARFDAEEKKLNLVGGQRCHSADGRTTAMPDPATDEVPAEVPELTRVDVTQTVDAAAAAFPPWSQLAAPQRRRVIRKVFELADSHAEDIARMITAEGGKPLAEVTYGLGFLDFAADDAVWVYGKTIPASTTATASEGRVPTRQVLLLRAFLERQS